MRCPRRVGRRGAFLSKASPAVLSRKARRNSSSIMRRQYAEPARLRKAGVAESEVSAQEIPAPAAPERSRPIRTNLAGPIVAPTSILGIRLQLQPLKFGAVNLSGRRTLTPRRTPQIEDSPRGAPATANSVSTAPFTAGTPATSGEINSASSLLQYARHLKARRGTRSASTGGN